MRVEYAKSLSQFFRLSDEEVKDASVASRLIEKYGPVRKHGFEWLDIGSGPLSKPKRIINELSKSGRLTVRHLRAIEPLKAWIPQLEINAQDCRRIGVEVSIEPVRLKEFKLPAGTPDWVTCFHALYQFEASASGFIGELACIDRLLRDGALLLVAIESPESDLLHIKQRVFPRTSRRLVSHKELLVTIEQQGWQILETVTCAQTLRIRLDGDEDIPWFALSDSVAPEVSLEEWEVKMFREAVIEQAVAVKEELGVGVLNIADLLMVVAKGRSS